jgi:glycerophosphoryl diester phosphodiesterase
VLTIAHRAGNGAATLRAALAARVDLVEADVHSYRRALEMRHRKWLGPRLLWDRGELVRRRAVEVPLLRDVLAIAGPAHAGRLMLDLKGLHPGLAPAVAAQLRATVAGAPVVICTRHWWMLRAFAPDPHVRLVFSAGSRRGLARLRARLATRAGGMRWFGVSVRRDLLTPPAVDALRAAVEHVLTWPVDTAADLADARRLGVGGVIGKNLPLLAELA